MNADTNWIAPRLTGGLGNRMFQCMAAIAVAEQTGRRPVFLLPRTARCEHGAYSLLFQLFPAIPILETAHDWVEVLEKTPIPQTDQGIVLKGLFQATPLYPSLSSPFLPQPLSPSRVATQDVAVHFRFGDYLILPHHQVPLTAYYEEALTLFPNSPLRLFSDEPARLTGLADAWRSKGRTITLFQTTDVRETLQEIAACQGGFIGCNSTFGFWAAWLAWNSNKRPSSYKAVFPDTWMQPGELNHHPTFLTASSFMPFLHVVNLKTNF